MDRRPDPRRRRLLSIAAFIISTVLLLSTPQPASGSPSTTTRRATKPSSSSSVFSLFNLKQKSRFWSESVIRNDFDDLESLATGAATSFANFTVAGNVAKYLNLLPIESMYLPVPVNFIFVGFDGKGNYDFKLHPEELERWFTKIDHVFEHTRVPPIGETLTPFYKISVDKDDHHSHNLPLVSHVNYNFSVHAIQMGEKVTSIFEKAVSVLARRDDVVNGGEDVDLWQVDVDMMDVLFSSLVEHLEIGSAYNIFVLNLKRNVKRGRYGYRRGLSDSEVAFVRGNASVMQSRIAESAGKVPEAVVALDKVKSKRPLYEKHPMAKFAWSVSEDTDTVEWYNACEQALENVEKLSQGKETGDVVVNKVVQLLNGRHEDMELLYNKAVKSGDFNDLHAECLTDTWIGRERWAFIDLSAGPFSWGPAVGGEGVRTNLSIPNVQKTIGAVTEITEDEAEDRLQDAIQEKFAVFGDKDHQAIDILLAEIDIYELFAFKHCIGRKVKLALCEELDERMRDLKNELQGFEGEEYDETHKKKALDALKRMENWNLFSDTQEEFQNYTIARDTFLSHLGATLWGSMRHIISPSVADGAFHHYDTVSFQLFFITQEKVSHIKKLPVDLQALQHGLSSLLLPSQTPAFSQHMLPLSEDPALAMAFSVARRAAAVPLLLVNGTYRKTVRAYLDSSIVQYQLQRLNDQGSLKGKPSHSRSTLEVPIFWFIHGEPLLVDKYYQAKSLSDMIIVVQSDSSSWESHLQCNGQSLFWNLRRPIKAALAAASEHLAGLLPLHLAYSHAHETAIEDWMWSAGCNPHSITSQGWTLSQFQSDTIARSYIITTLDESIQIVNSAIQLLGMELTTEKIFKIVLSEERDLLNKYNYVVSLWRRISTTTGELRYTDAMRMLHVLEDGAKQFADQVNATIANLHPIHCTKDRRVDVEYSLSTAPAFLVVLGILYFVLRPRRPKPKVN
ncbi:uncharacterized protein LOC126790182 [Argentina anserina]|uniref:uncharacterized protein LOC126790182 n=1 Tax=Argentina anserina TaxID=57926 RepID=UPI00217629E7|nr:uncharacterized protein LOC126790182 [Potentilla anserina]